jgi:hypothetical protein
MDAVRKPSSRAPWSAIAPGEHSLQIYADDSHFVDTLEGFVTGGILKGEGVVVIATAPHLHELEKRLRSNSWLELDRARWQERYIALLAQEVLGHVMDNGRPDEARFEATLQPLLSRARVGGRKMRAFGQMVALLWAEGNTAAALHLERLWNDLLKRERFSLFCAYPRSCFNRDAEASLHAVCAAHSRMI